MEIHPTAVVSAGAELAQDVKILPYSIIGENVTIGSGTVVGPHALIDGWTQIGVGNRIGPFCAIGTPPQDLSYKGEKTRVEVGDENVLREYVSIHRGTQRGAGVTRVGSRNYVMAYAHIAHDCRLGDSIIMANAATLGGHVHVGDHASLGGLVAVHQFARIGTHAFLGGACGAMMDIPPYMLAFGTPAKLYGPNLVGLRRSGMPAASISALKKAYRIIFRSSLIFKDALERVKGEVEPVAEVEILLKFLSADSKRGITR
jgi:UDP-N-acetylglucosamine acyltransferase